MLMSLSLNKHVVVVVNQVVQQVVVVARVLKISNYVVLN